MKRINAGVLVLGIGAAALFALLTRPSTRAELRDAFDPSSPYAVARTVCRARADIGEIAYDVCIQQAVPGMPPKLVNMPGQR